MHTWAAGPHRPVAGQLQLVTGGDSRPPDGRVHVHRDLGAGIRPGREPNGQVRAPDSGSRAAAHALAVERDRLLRDTRDVDRPRRVAQNPLHGHGARTAVGHSAAAPTAGAPATGTNAASSSHIARTLRRSSTRRSPRLKASRCWDPRVLMPVRAATVLLLESHPPLWPVEPHDVAGPAETSPPMYEGGRSAPWSLCCSECDADGVRASLAQRFVTEASRCSTCRARLSARVRALGWWQRPQDRLRRPMDSSRAASRDQPT
jgi:hypothetical protein